ncbi:histidine phosphatase family protein [Veronia nyctiphanis]|nr:histidine phosphatase family protein [Veronia nyctiphanis]
MDIFFLRHAESLSNCNGSYSSDPGEPLTQKGYMDAERIIPDLLDLNLDIIMCSPCLRARDTIAPIKRELDISVNILPALAEGQNIGVDQLISPEPADFVFDANGELFPPEDESAGAFLSRVRQSVSTINEIQAKRILVVSHGHMLREILNEYLQTDVKICFPHDNCGLTHISIGSGVTCHYINRIL